MSNTKQTKPKRLLSLLLTLAMVLGMLPVMSMTAFAYSGSGTEDDPYIVTAYDELREKINTNDVSYVKLGADITVDDNLNENFLEVLNYSNTTLDLAGHTLSRNYTALDRYAIYVSTYSTGGLTINDSVGGGGISVCATAGNQITNLLRVTNGNVTINGGTFIMTDTSPTYGNTCLYINGGAVTINGGSFSGQLAAVDYDAGALTINGGTFENTSTGIGLGAMDLNSNANFTINNCTLKAPGGGYLIYIQGRETNSDTWIVNRLPNATFMVDGETYIPGSQDRSITGQVCIITKNVTTDPDPDPGTDPGSGSGTKDDPYVVTTYAELKNLMATAPKDSSTRYIKLGADLLSNSNSNNNDLELVDARARVDLDLAGHSITRDETTSDWSVFYVHTGYLTVRDSVGTGRVVENIRGAAKRNVFHVSSDAHLTIESGTFESKTYNVIFGQGGTTVINGGTFTNEAVKYDDAYRVINFAAGKLTINGGEFRGRGYGIEFNKGVEVTINACTVSLSHSSGFLISVNGGERVTDSRFGEYSKIVKADGTGFDYYEKDGVIYYDLRGAYCRVIGPIPVTKVAIEGIVPPVAGETPSNIVGGDTVLEHCSIDKYIGGEHVGENTIEWVDYYTMNPVETFEAGRDYMVTIRLVADEGFSFSTKAAVYETLTVNGDDDAFVWKVQNDGKYAYIGYIFTCPAAQTITSMGADVTGFELLNSYFEVEATPLDSSKYTIRDITWSDCHLTDDSPIITDSSMFEAGETWQLKLWFKPAAGYCISNPDTLPVTIAGQTATYVGTDGDYYGYKIEKTFSKYLHDYIDLSMDAPTSGMTPAEYAETIKIKNNDRFPYNNFEIGEVQCYRTDWNDFSTFAAGTTYFVYVEIDLKDDTSFEFAHHDSDITALVNGTPVEEYVVVDADSTWESNFNTYGGVRLSYQVYFTAKGEPTGVTVSGTATSFGSNTDDVTIQLIESGASEAAYEAVIQGNTANYSISNVEPGTYTLKVEKKGHAPWTEEITVGRTAVTKDVTVYLYGDVNRNGTVTSTDALQISQYIAGTRSFDAYQMLLADVNRKNGVTSADALWVSQRVAGTRDIYYNNIS